MPTPVKVIVTTEGTQQSAAEIQQFANASTKALNETTKAATQAATVTAGQMKSASRALGGVASNLAFTASMFVGPQASQMVYGATIISKEFKGISAAMKLAGVSASVASGGLLALTGVVAIGASGWSAYKAKVYETETALKAIAKQGELTKTILKALHDESARIPAGQRDSLESRLKGAAPDLEIEKAKAQLAEIAQNRANLFQARRASGSPDFETEKEFQSTFGKRIEDLKAIAAKAPLSPIQREATGLLSNVQQDEETVKNLARINQQIRENQAARMQGFAKEREEARITHDKELADLEAMKVQNPSAEDLQATAVLWDEIGKKRDATIAGIDQRERELNQKNLAEMQQFYRTKEAQADAFYTREQEQIAELTAQVQREAAGSIGPLALLEFDEAAAKARVDATVSDHRQAEELKTVITEDFARRRTEIRQEEARKEIEVRREVQESMVGILGSAAAAAKLFGKQGFAVWKGLAMAEAVSAGALAVVKQLGGGDPYSAPFRAAAAAAAAAVQIATIASTQPAGFKAGGFTGTGDVNEPAGIVHRGEFVMDAATVNDWGISNMVAIQKGPEAFAASGGAMSRSEERRNVTIHVHHNKKDIMDALREDIEAIAIETGIRRRVNF